MNSTVKEDTALGKVSRSAAIMVALFFFAMPGRASAVETFLFDDLYLDEDQVSSVRSDIKNYLELRGQGDSVESPFRFGVSAWLFFIPWNNGEIPVRFSPKITKRQKAHFWRATRQWEEVANVNFFAHEEKPDKQRYVYVQAKSDEGCRSAIGQGLLGPRERKLNLASGCWTTGIILHELGHAMGLFHEHQRSDRNRYLSIALENVKKGSKGNFFSVFWAKKHGAYDFQSVMHYRAQAFSKNGKPTLVPHPRYQRQAQGMGQRSFLSVGDKQTAADIY